MSAVVETVMPDPIELTETAANKVKQLLDDEDNKSMRLRAYVTGGGCSGFQYGFKFDDQLADDDTLIKRNGAEMAVDSLSYQYLVGAVVDYEEGLEGSRFLVKNPNATATCGCGSSFSI
ncbi:iron-sulfur cluster insertion protein ErpA [Endozoicomonas sp. OPT23]|uniref:iron-sulfur cluster insertion protein ErpA n=1 Tax=Endozoicomonas sp. OPT23 TaxID=2072845 RepID=UPI00129B8C5F|nr:iron-sulfur cluster insertion protein ErpA [Endozoicomonas sp. OPT23]MRI33439.1 iron-sulfur cluster insertion protein ErpA [Endozoicomonas sp. OPT23]